MRSSATRGTYVRARVEQRIATFSLLYLRVTVSQIRIFLPKSFPYLFMFVQNEITMYVRR